MALEFEPIIAEKYEISDDGITYTFNIRDGLKFHDGSTVTAADVKYTFDRASNPDAPAQAVSFISALKQTDLPDDKTVVMTLTEPSAPYLANIAVEYFGIMPQAAVEAAGDDFGTSRSAPGRGSSRSGSRASRSRSNRSPTTRTSARSSRTRALRAPTH